MLSTPPQTSLRLNDARTPPVPGEGAVPPPAEALLCEVLAVLVMGWVFAITGCGSGGYPGGGAFSLSTSALTLDAGQSFAITSTVSGGSSLTWSLTGASCTGAGCGTLSSSSGAGVTYTAPSGTTAPTQLTLTGALAGTQSKQAVSITVNPDPTIQGVPPAGVVGVAYSTTLTASGGTAPLVWSLASGSLPAGLSFNAATGVISGTPASTGTATFVVRAIDSSALPYAVTANESITITAAVPALSVSGAPPSGTVGAAYTAALSATGGVAPYTWTVLSGSLPAGLTLNPATGVIAGTPTTQGSFAFAAQAQDATGTKASASFTILISAAQVPLTLGNGTLPNGTVGVTYNSTIGVSGGTSPYACTVTTGTLPAGLTLTGCVVSGTPTTAGTVALMVKATDSASPANTGTGPESITINPAPSLTISAPPAATAGAPYSGVIPVTGGNGPYSCTITTGTLPAGLTLTGCTLSGTPTTPGTTPVTVKANDSSTPSVTASSPINIVVNPAPLTLTTTSLPNGTVGIAYNAPIGVAGGVAPYTCVFTAGTLPAGLALTGCTVSGTPTASQTANLTVKATDSNGNTVNGPESITISAAAPLVISSPPAATVGTVYTGAIPVSGGNGPYTCTLTAGTLPAGLSLNGCNVTGTPTTPGSATVTVKGTDSSTPPTTGSGPVTLTVNPAPLALTTTSLPNGTVGVPYSAPIGITGGIAPYTCMFTAGTLPAGLALAGCTVSGTPTVAGTANLTVKATDSSGNTTAGPESITIAAAPAALTISSPPAATVGIPYTGVIPVSGGTAPYTCALTGGTVPAGLTLTGCTLTGTPTVSGTTPLTVRATDSSSPTVTSSGPVTVTVNPAPATITIASPPAGTVGVPYTGPIAITGGTAPYTCTQTSGTLPAGLTLSGCTVTGTPTTAGPGTIAVTVTDSASPHGTGSGPVTVAINPVPQLTFTGALPNAVVNQPYTRTLAASGGVGPYTYAMTAGTLPAGITVSSTGVVSGTPTTVGAYSFTMTATDAEATPQTANLPLVLLVTYAPTTTDAELTGPYAFLFQGYDDVAFGVLAYKTDTIGSFTADGTGVVSAGELDSNHQSSTSANGTVASNRFLGTYQLNPDNRGLLTITTLNANGTVANTHTYAISLKAPVSPATTVAQGSLIEYDNNNAVGTKGSGTLLQQTPASFATGLSGSYAFGLQGESPCLLACTVNLAPGPVASVGALTANAGTIGGLSDANIAAVTYPTQTLSGSYGSADGNGRVQMNMVTGSLPAGYPADYAVYVVNANQALVMSTDVHSANALLAGNAQLQTQSAFSNASITGPFIGYENSATNPGLVSATLQNTLNLSTATIFRATGTADGACNVSNVDVGGADSLVTALTGLGGSLTGLNNALGAYRITGGTTCPVASSGRGVFAYPQQTVLGLPVGTPPAPRVFYLAGPDRGFFLETGYAGLGNLEPQVGAPFSLATFNGTYVYASTPASTLASINTSGNIVADGAGHETSTVDMNVGVGTLNVLQTGVTSSGTYVYASPDPAVGRYTINGTTVFYAINPNRFVLVDTNPLTTSPSITLLY